jgi:hypothetical protein
MDRKFRASFSYRVAMRRNCLKAAEEALNDMALAVSMTIISALLKPSFTGWDDGMGTGTLDASDKSVGVIAFVRDHLFCTKLCDEGRSLGNVMYFTSGEVPAQWIAQRINDHVKIWCSTRRAICRSLARLLFLGAGSVLVGANDGAVQ